MAEAVPQTGGAELMGTVARTVIAHEALSFDTEGGEVSQGAFEEEHGAGLAFIGHDLGESQTGSIIDANMDELPSGPAHLIASIVSDAMTGAHDLAQLFDIEVEQLARALALIADHRRSRVQSAQTGQAVPAEQT
jgi:hypothetical protein